MNLVNTIRRAIAAQIPGSAVNIAREKRELERQLRADGWSRAAAKAETHKRYVAGKSA